MIAAHTTGAQYYINTFVSTHNSAHAESASNANQRALLC